MCIPDGNPVNEALRLEEEHMKNLKDFLPGLPDSRVAILFLCQVQQAEPSFGYVKEMVR